MIVSRTLYNLFLPLYKTGMILLSPWNPKAALWLRGRKNLFRHIEASVRKAGGRQCIWMHCASLGEFEQGRPVLENVRLHFPDSCIVLTFFSPSGYEIKKDYPGADFVFYLPADSTQNAVSFLDIINPALVLWVKYEYWYHYITETKKRNIPLLLISAFFRKHQLFFKSYGMFYRRMLQCFSHIFVQDEVSMQMLGSIGFTKNVTVSGDTRFDRVVEVAESFKAIEVVEKFCAGHQVIIAGSTWPDDEEELDHFANSRQDLRFIIAPHEIDRQHLKEIKKLFKHSILYSELAHRPANENGPTQHNHDSLGHQANVLIIDNIGMLSRLYKYATITYIGGGFGNDGVHNVLEAAVYGKPVVFGPVYEKFIEAEELVTAGGAFSIENGLELEDIFVSLLNNPAAYQKACEASKEYVYLKKGATQKIVDFIMQHHLPVRSV